MNSNQHGNAEKQAEYVTRDQVLKALSDDEISKLSTAEAATHLPADAEYLDLEQLARGVQRGPAKAIPIGRVLTRTAVHADTWTKILGMIGSKQAAS